MKSIILTLYLLLSFGSTSVAQSEPKNNSQNIDSLIIVIDSLKLSQDEYKTEIDTLKAQIKRLEAKMIKKKREEMEKWRKLEMYMSQTEVKKLLGEPTSITRTSTYTIYWYGNGFVEFNAFKKVSEWAEPKEERLEVIEY